MLKFLKIALLLNLFLLLVSNGYSATEFTSTINHSGEDYNTIALWEAAMDNAGNIVDGTVKTGNWDGQSGSDIADATAVTWDSGSSTGTLIHMTNNNSGSGGDQYLIDVTAGTLANDDTVSDGTNTFNVNGTPDSSIITAEIFNDDGTLTGTFVIDGLVTGADNYWKITSPEGERHQGVYDETYATIDGGTGSGNAFLFQDEYWELSYLQLRKSTPPGASASRIMVRIESISGSTSQNVCNNIFKDFGGAVNATSVITGVSQADNQANLLIYNNIFIDFYSVYRTDQALASSSAGVVNMYNNTIYSAGIGVNQSSGTVTLTNNIFQSVTTDATGTFTDTYNLTDLASGPSGLSGTGTVFESTLTFEDTANDNYDLVSTDTDAIDAGTSLSGTFTDDIIGTTRPQGSNWDIGAFEFIASAGVPISEYMRFTGVDMTGVLID
jgi:hypothetical protein